MAALYNIASTGIHQCQRSLVPSYSLKAQQLLGYKAQALRYDLRITSSQSRYLEFLRTTHNVKWGRTGFIAMTLL